METVNLVIKIFFLGALIFFFIYSALTLIALWRFSISKPIALLISLSFGVMALILVANGLFSLSQI